MYELFKSPAFDNAVTQFDRACENLALDEWLRDRLRFPQRTLIVSCPIRMDNGEIRVFTGYRVQHNLTLSELEHLTRRYTAEILPIIGPNKDIPAPDMGTNPQVMAWMMATYSMTEGYTTPAVVTGKPVIIGGSLGREAATGYGVAYIVEDALRHFEQRISGTRVAIQGFGNVGTYTARKLSEMGCSVVAVSDMQGGIYNASGLPVLKLLEIPRQRGRIQEFKEADKI